MSKQYTIRAGFSFREDNGGVKQGGETIFLEDDVASEHAHKLEEVVKPSRKPAKPAAPVVDAGTEQTSDAEQGGGDAPAADAESAGSAADPG